MVRDRALAEDIAQETFLKAFSHLGGYDPGFKFSNWILRIAHNSAIDAIRRRPPQHVSIDTPDPGAERRLDQVLIDPRSGAAQERAEQRDVARALRGALDELRPEYRQIVVLRYHQDLSYEEIAGITGLPLGTVKSNLHRARVEMAGHLGRLGWRGPVSP
jgi:RNA polymerase sigma-70 factor (ECF subfamily)